MLLIVGVIAGMFSGIATATEVGALGVLGSLVLAAFMRTLTWKNFIESCYSAVAVTCMIGLILQGSSVLSAAMAILHEEAMKSFSRGSKAAADFVEAYSRRVSKT